MSRDALIDAFLADAGWADAQRRPLAADWSTRRYERLTRPGGTAILMDAPAPWTHQAAPFVTVAALLRGAGLSAPEVFADASAHGLLLLEDFGDDLYAARLDRGEDPWPVYRRATDVLIHLHRHLPAADTVALPAWDAARFGREVALFADAFAPAALGRPLTDGERADIDAAWAAVLPAGFGVPTGLLLRDYFPGNLMALPGRPGVRACGLLDIQDAGPGPVSYDLLSLLQDARRDVPAEIADAMVRRWLDAFPQVDAGAFRGSMAVLAALRHARILGRVAQLAAEARAAGRSARQLSFLPRVWGQFTAAIADPACAPVAGWVAGVLTIPDPVAVILGDIVS